MRACILPFVFLLIATGARADLTGRWSCNDGGTYYLRQNGGRLYWFGEAAGGNPAWANVFTGRIAEGRIEGQWVDVPKGRATASGRLELVIEADGRRLRAVTRTGGFAGSRWQRRQISASVVPSERLTPAGTATCAHFDPDALDVQQVNGHWKVAAGRHWLYDFAGDETAARRAAAVIRHYRMDRICRVGRPDPAMTYLLARGGVPTGPMPDEDCNAFDPRRATVSKMQGRWKIVSGRARVMDFGDRADDARASLATIRRYGFNRICHVGRPKAGFTYFRR